MAALQLHLVETNQQLKEAQRTALGVIPAHWHDTLDDVPDGDSFIIANEFLDCLPIRQFVRAGDKWRERQVGLSNFVKALREGR